MFDMTCMTFRQLPKSALFVKAILYLLIRIVLIDTNASVDVLIKQIINK